MVYGLEGTLWGTMGHPYGDLWRQFKAPPAYSPYQGQGDFSQLGQNVAPPSVQPYAPPPIPPSPTPNEPNYALQLQGLHRVLANAKQIAAQGRQDAGQTHAGNIQSIGTNTMDRGIAFSGVHDLLNQKENDAYTKQLRDLAQALAAAQQKYQSDFQGLQLENSSYQNQQGKPFYPKGGSIDFILQTIRQRESGGNYHITNPHSSASGAYQFTDPTWQGLLRQFGLSGPAHAGAANPALQDTVARDYANYILSQHGGNLEWVPAVWYAGQGGAQQPWSHEPNPGMSIQSYVDAWLKLYQNLYGRQYT